MKTTTLSLLISLFFIFNTAYASMQSIDFEPEEEEYIDDIPFESNTAFSTVQLFYDTNETDEINTINYDLMNKKNDRSNTKFTEFDLKDEEYIDDIPFDTKEVFNSMVNFDAGDKNVIVKEFSLPEEQYVDDIPFDTKQLIRERLCYPEFARKSGIEGTVSVSCRYDENGFLKVVDCNCSDQSLKDYILSLLQSIRLREGIISPEQNYVLRFNFRSI